MTPQWQYNEFRQVGTDYSDVAHVEAYDQHMQKLRDSRKEIAQMIDCLDLKPDHTILEIGAGTGEFAIEAARICAAVHALDVSPAMLLYAQQKAEEARVSNIQFHHAGFLTYEHQGKPPDAVVSQLALHHLPDFWKMIALHRIFKMLKAGGKFYFMDTVYSFESTDHVPFFNEWLDTVNETAGTNAVRDVEMAIREEFSTLDWIMEGLLKRAGFRIEKETYPTGFMAVYVCVKPIHGGNG